MANIGVKQMGSAHTVMTEYHAGLISHMAKNYSADRLMKDSGEAHFRSYNSDGVGDRHKHMAYATACYIAADYAN